MQEYVRHYIMLLILLVIGIILFTGYNYFDYRITYYRTMNTRGQLEELGKIIEKYFQFKSKYPSRLSQLVPEYTKVMPEDSWGTPILLDIGKGFLYSFGADRLEGTGDDILYKINTPFMLKKVRAFKSDSGSNTLTEGDVVRLYFTDDVSGFGTNPDNDFLFYDHNGYPLINSETELPGKNKSREITFGAGARYAYVEEDSDILDIQLGKDPFIVPGNIRLNLKSSSSGRIGNSILSGKKNFSIPSATPLLLQI